MDNRDNSVDNFRFRGDYPQKNVHEWWKNLCFGEGEVFHRAVMNQEGCQKRRFMIYCLGTCGTMPSSG